MSSSSLFALIRSDYRRYRATGAQSWIGVVCFTPGFWASAAYRILHKFQAWNQVRGLGAVVRLVSVIVSRLIEIVSGISLPAECEVGEGLYIAHFGTTVVHPSVRVGRNCNLSQGVTIGIAGRGSQRGAPTLGDRVFIAPNCVVFGRIRIGNDVAIGAGSIVTQDVPDRAVVAGNPARVVSFRGSFDFVAYDGMELDPDREESMRRLTE